MMSVLTLACVSFLDGYGENNRGNYSNNPGGQERNLRGNLPQETTNRGGGRDRKAAYQIIKSHRSRSQILAREVNDHRLTRRFSDFSKTTNDERDYEKRETRSHHHGQRK